MTCGVGGEYIKYSDIRQENVWMKSGSNEREIALSLLTSGLRLMTGKVSGPPLFAASSHHPPKRRVTPSIWGKTMKMVVIMRVMMLNDLQPTVISQPDRTGSYSSTVPWPGPGGRQTTFSSEVSLRARKIFVWMIVSWLDHWQLTNDFHFENSKLAKFT